MKIHCEIARNFLIAAMLLSSAGACSGRGFTEKSESMLPTLKPDEHFFVETGKGPPTTRGTVVVVVDPSSDQKRVYRLIGLPGDLIEMRNGVPIINGREARQTNKGPSQFTNLMGVGKATLLEEQLPGETEAYQILDDGSFPPDEMEPIKIPAGKYFVMGDGRDRSADSRIDPSMHGLGLISDSQVFGFVQMDSIKEPQ